MLDGDHLWLAVEGVAADSGFALEVGDGPPIHLHPEASGALRGDREGGVQLRADLLHLPLPAVGVGETWSARVLAVAAGGDVCAVALPKPPEEDATTTPRSSTGWWQHAIRRGPYGELVLKRTGHAPWAEVVAVEADDERLRAVLAPPPGADGAGTLSAAALVDREGRRLCRLDVRSVGGSVPPRLEVTVPADVPVPTGTGARVVLIHPTDVAGATKTAEDSGSPTTPVRRRRHELTHPDASVSLPGLVDARAEKPLLRWRWFPDGTLAVQRPRGGGPGAPPAAAGGSA